MMRWVLAAAALCGLVGAGYAAYLEGEGEEAQQAAPPIVRPMPPRPVPPPAGDDALTRAIRRITVRAGQAHKGLTVFTLETSAVEDEADYVSAAEALKKGDLTIREKGMEIVDVKIPADSSTVGKTVKELSLPPETILSLIISKERKPRVPTASTVIRAEDQIIAATPAESEDALRAALRGA